MNKREFTCIGCPLGCLLTVELSEKNQVLQVKGNTCRRGEVYAGKEVTNPTRIVTSTVCVEGGVIPVVSVKTETDIPKEKVFDCIHALKTIKVKAPIHIGEIITKNIAGTKVNIIATKEVPKDDKYC